MTYPIEQTRQSADAVRADGGPAAPRESLPVRSDAVAALAASALSRSADLAALAFATTAEIEPIEDLVGQERAAGAIRFGTQIERPGFNLFVIGPSGAAMQDTVKTILEHQAVAEPSPQDWVYVNNFVDADKPIAITLPAGRAPKLRDAVDDLIDDFKTALPAVFQSEDYQTRRSAIDEEFHKKQGEAFSALSEKASEKSIAIMRTPFGFALAPMQHGKVVPPEEFGAWPEEKRAEVQATMQALEKELEHVVRQLPKLEKERRDEIRTLNRETAKIAVDQLIEEVKKDFADLPRIAAHFAAVRDDLIDNIAIFVVKSDDEDGEPIAAKLGNFFERYEVNVLVTQADREPGAPIVEELHPNLGNLLGRIDYVSLHGVMVTNFRLIKAGALHRANGGYLLLDVRHVLSEPFSWTALKRILRRGAIGIEDISRFLGLTSTLSLEPDPIPLDVKVILFGERLLYFLMASLDPDLAEHFKVLADFENDFARSTEHEGILARLLAGVIRRDRLRPLDREAVALLLEHAARLAGHSGKLTLQIERLRDVLAEADFWAKSAGRDVVARADVQHALDERIHRASRLRDRTQEAILQKVALIDTAGTHVGQVNGLSVVDLGGFSFGQPTRITCQVRPGSGKVVDIEREVELGGPIHSKGVLILSGFLAGRFALDTPMSLFASLVFEQSYGGVEGDSASSAELYALLSALSEAPLRQDLAVTGSVNQHGEVQAIGGVNEKIEGFFDVCRARGLTGMQGVLIPAANVQHLMLRRDVIEACAAGQFVVYPIATVDQGIALLTGLAAGMRGDDGRYPAGTINRLVEDRLRAFAQVRRSFAREPEQAQRAE
ncbi:MAG TPA: AAA family ATPase [Xanthobacteraceae bacterium]|nr:AAA family ATPase [Xanthobacteraceae bacterium]